MRGRRRVGAAAGLRRASRRCGAAARDDRLEVAAGRQRAVLQAAVAGRGARRRRRRRRPAGAWRTSSEPCRPAPCLRPRAGRGTRAWRGRRTGASARSTCASRRASAPAASSTSARNTSSERGERDERAQHVEADHVARALPDRGQRRLAVQARHPGLLDVAVAAEALQRLERVVGRALAGPVLADRGGQALEQLGVAVVARLRARRRAASS